MGDNMTMRAVKILDVYRKARSHVKQSRKFNGFIVELSPDTGVNILDSKKNGITIRESWRNGQVEILVGGYRHSPASRDLQITRDSIQDLFDAIDADKKTDSIEKYQIKSIVKAFIEQA